MRLRGISIYVSHLYNDLLQLTNRLFLLPVFLICMMAALDFIIAGRSMRAAPFRIQHARSVRPSMHRHKEFSEASDASSNIKYPALGGSTE